MICSVFKHLDPSFTFDGADQVHSISAALGQRLCGGSRRLEKNVKKEKNNNITNLLYNYLRGQTFFTTACERSVKEVKEGSEPSWPLDH